MKMWLLFCFCLLQITAALAADKSLTPTAEKQLFTRATRYAAQPHRLETAAKLFDQLVSARPDNLLYLRLYSGLLLQLGDYERAGSLCREFLTRLPPGEKHASDRVELFALMSEVSFYTGDEIQAEFFRQEALRQVDDRPLLLLPLIISLGRLKQEEQLLEIIGGERRRHGDDLLWHLQAGDSYQRQGDWLAAFQEYIRGYADSRARERTLRNRIIELPLTGELLTAAQDWGRANPDSEPIVRTLSQWFVHQGLLSEAVPYYLELDQIAGSTGKELMHLGGVLVKEKAWPLALTLLREHQQNHPHSRQAFERSLLLATCLQATGEFQAAVDLLQELLPATKDRNQRSNLRIVIGDILAQDLRDPRGALSWYEAVDGPGSWLASAYLRRATALLQLNEITAARELNHEALLHFGYDKRLRAQLQFQEAGLHYFAGDFERSSTLLDTLAADNFEQPHYNNLIRLSQLLKSGDPEELSRLAAAELAALQGAEADALAAWLELLAVSPEGEVLLRAVYSLSELSDLTGAIDADSLAQVIETAAARVPDAIQLDELLFMRDQLLADRFQRPATALPGWERFLVDYPRSPRADAVRAQIRRYEADNQTRED